MAKSGPPRDREFIVKLLNVGCGMCFHPEWTNVDLVSHSPSVLACDLTRGIPFGDEMFDAVYHSHVLEHLQPHDGGEMLKECVRVLAPGGVLRVVVPDLERIAIDYLRELQIASEHPSEAASLRHRWMIAELIDQMVRNRRGGSMGPVMKGQPDQTVGMSSDDSKAWSVFQDFVADRMGHEVGGNAKVSRRPAVSTRVRKLIRRFRRTVAGVSVRMIDGRDGYRAYREGQFRSAGEVHRWMYDRLSLAAAMTAAGLEDVRVCRAEESRIAGFDHYQLDRDGVRVRKPDSLFMEAVRPRQQDAANRSCSQRSAASRAA